MRDAFRQRTRRTVKRLELCVEGWVGSGRSREVGIPSTTASTKGRGGQARCLSGSQKMDGFYLKHFFQQPVLPKTSRLRC